MKKYVLIYLILWLPAALVSYFFQSSSTLSTVLQWAFAALMILGWSITTGFSGYHYPKRTFVVILLYSGISLLLITWLYTSEYGTLTHQILLTFGGILSFKPLDIMIKALIDFNIPQEIYVTGALVAGCFIGFIVGLVYRRIRPNPYRPRLLKYRG